MAKKYHKLVRDKIPQIIRSKGDTPVTHTASPSEYDEKIREKLREEIEEFLESNNPEELADILEVIYAISGRLGLDASDLENLRQRKADERGGFEKGIILDEA